MFSKENTFWAFFSQILDSDGGCQEVVRKVQALAAKRSLPVPSASTSAYCQARSKLDPAELEKILAHTAQDLQQQGRSRWWKDRRVVVVDGTGVSVDPNLVTRKYAQDIGNGSSTSIVVTHSLGTLDVIVQLYDKATGEQVDTDVLRTSTSQVTINFATAPASAAYRVLVQG